MGLLVYKFSDYRTTHEREQYRILCKSLQRYYTNNKDWCIFIANYNIGNVELDGLLIKKDAIICIEFKKYGGEIYAADNGEWIANGDIIKGGSGKTVFQQALYNHNMTRKGLRTGTSLDNKQTKDISGIIVFHKPIISLDNQLSEMAQCWLHITDNEHFIEKIQDVTTEKLYLEPEDFLNLLKELNLQTEYMDEQYCDSELLDYKPEHMNDEDGIFLDRIKNKPTPHMESKILTINSMLPTSYDKLGVGKTYVGIDFGTSTTVVSIATLDSAKNQVVAKPIRLKQLLIDGTPFESEKLPTVIAHLQGKLLVGEGASQLKYQLKKGKNIWYSFKMEIGEDLGAKYYESELKDSDKVRIRNPKDAVRVFFLYLQLLIQRFCEQNALSTSIQYSVSIPASFEANQRKELIEALDTNGMKVSNQALIDEPNAAFISYVQDSIDTEEPIILSSNYNPKVLVFDFGGGTCDISILEIGKDLDGLYSKNIAISKFAQMGGDDIDRYITYRYVLPRFLEANNVKITDFLTTERKFIASQLYKVSEQLKIQVCKDLSIKAIDLIIPADVRNSERKFSISMPISISTTKGELFQEYFSLSLAEMSELMKVFLRQSELPTCYKHEEDYNNIFIPINSAIRKAKIKKEEIDYILLIGGSAQNPFVQEALRLHFEDSKILVPQDLQTHVSKGAAINSLLLHGLGKCIIKPITSEPIILLTQDTRTKVLLEAGANIPCDVRVVDDLVTTRENQDVIELPICVGNSSKLLYNLKIKKEGGFPLNTPVSVAIEINADKLLIAKASCMGQTCMIEPQNPFANKELTTEERIILQAERQANLDAEANGGIPPKNTLIALRRAYEKVGNDFRAAETYERQLELYPSSNEYNAIGVLYHNSGNYDKAIEFYERALMVNPNDIYPNFNLGLSLERKDPKRSEEYLRKVHSIDPYHAPTNIELANIEQRLGNIEKQQELLERAYDTLMQKWKTDTMSTSDYSWLASVASKLGHADIAIQVRQSQPKLESEKYYNVENLTRTKNTEISKL
jgi:molecular chaperone DnaK (HSP70)